MNLTQQLRCNALARCRLAVALSEQVLGPCRAVLASLHSLQWECD